eukprot:Gregarina_sp_Pseudo_9__2804@NODE_3039_length_775_cov_289_139946_g2771_i0_p2_GENE_NODE_3039_length_775_cov_289_139946_g2771_i0NODE_3039_length_775_cov_289_139946_g2771_i0_p2_ORF_typecomplete_len123_score8_84DUF2114/PF09887_9/0_061_NODE_3039_length_775_cov_289_139946_g2771_i0143511
MSAVVSQSMWATSALTVSNTMVDEVCRKGVKTGANWITSIVNATVMITITARLAGQSRKLRIPKTAFSAWRRNLEKYRLRHTRGVECMLKCVGDTGEVGIPRLVTKNVEAQTEQLWMLKNRW